MLKYHENSTCLSLSQTSMHDTYDYANKLQSSFGIIYYIVGIYLKYEHIFIGINGTTDMKVISIIDTYICSNANIVLQLLVANEYGSKIIL